MKKKLQSISLLIILCVIGILVSNEEKRKVSFEVDDDAKQFLSINMNKDAIVIYPWEDISNGDYYFFLPAFIEESTDKISEKYEEQFPTEENSVTFVKSANISTVFIETESGSMDYLRSDKNNEEQGHIRIVGTNGNVEYSGKLDKITGRGNSSWRKYNKKPYTIDLCEQVPLLGMDSGKKWYLMPVWREGNRMNTKVVMDIATELGLQYTPQCKWIDIYFNGEYAGNYLLCESVSVGEGRVEISDLQKENKINNPDIEKLQVFEESSYKGYELENGDHVDGGYLIEKDFSEYYDESNSGFVTNSGNRFSIKAPSYASREQVIYISNHFQRIEDMIQSGMADYENYIDLESFASRFLVDEISLNFDAGVTSMYFYKDSGSDKVYAGPVWDYDGAMGEANYGWLQGHYVDYEWSTLNGFRGDEEINWYQFLYLDEAFYNQVITSYVEILPYMDELLEVKIDSYANEVRASAYMDSLRWKNENTKEDYPGHYTTFDNNVRYLKYFLANRLNYLIDKWGIAYEKFVFRGNEDTHEVKLICNESIVETMVVQDGDTLLDLPYLDEEKYLGWYFVESDEKYRDKIPILEDCVLYAREQ